MARRPETVACPSGPGPLVLVETQAHTLALCENGAARGSFGVRLGKNGTGKAREGDGKTPLGRYALSDPQPSSSYGVFIPIGYPTSEQRRRGYTGSAVGVHGPGRGVRWLGSWVNTFDLTDGCVGIATDAEMERVAAWVRERHAKEIILR
jgi:murein L,D-transpeptidase YafK